MGPILRQLGTTIRDDFYRIPDALADLSEVQDKTGKLALAFFSFGDSLTRDLKNNASIFALFALPKTLNDINSGDTIKKVSNYFNAVGQSIDVATGLNALKLISLDKIAKFNPVLDGIIENLTFVKNSAVLISTTLSLKTSFAKNINYTEAGCLNNESLTLVIGIVSDVSRFFFMAVNMAASSPYLEASFKIVQLGNATVTLGKVRDVLSVVSAITAFVKSMHVAADKARAAEQVIIAA